MVFTPAAEVSNDHRGEEAQADIENKRRHIVADARTFIFVTQNLAVNHPTDDAGDEEHESVHHALQQRHRHHIAILHMAHFMGKNGFNFLSIHRAQKSRRHCDERIGARGARSKSVGFAFIDGDFRHRKTRFIGELAHGFNDVLLHAVAGIIHVNHREAHRHLRHHLGGEERDDRTREAHHHREDEKCSKVEVRTGHSAEIDAEHHLHHREDHGKHDEDGEIGQNEEADALKHGYLLPSRRPSGRIKNCSCRFVFILMAATARCPANV